ncbi:EamA family transporter [Streptomyces sp. NPDC054796]
MAELSSGLRTSHIGRGVAPILGFATLTAALDVYGGNKLQVISPETMAAISFSLAAVFFLGLEITRRGAAATFRPMRTHSYDVTAINVTTAVTWLSMLYSLKYLEPAVVSIVVVALGPVLTLLMGPLLRRGSSVIGAEIGVSLGISAVLGVLVWGSFTGRSGVGDVGTGQAALGMLFALLCGVGSTANIIYMKRLSETGHSPQAVLAIRFFLMIAISWVMTALSDEPELGAGFVPGLIVAVIGVGLPIYVLQIGIRHTEPITTSLLLSLSPLITFLLQFLDGRLRPSALTLTGIFAIVVLVGAGTLARSRYDARTSPPEEEKPLPTAPKPEPAQSETAPAQSKEELS